MIAESVAELKRYTNHLIRKKAEKEVLGESFKRQRRELRDLERQEQYTAEAVVLIQEVARQTQHEVEVKLSGIGSNMLSSILRDPYELQVTFLPSRNNTGVEITLLRDGMEIDPLTASGGGIVDVVAFSLRASVWSIAKPRSRNTFILDEPFRFVSKDYQAVLTDVLKELDQRLGLQFIVVTHEEALSGEADAVFTVCQADGISAIS